MIDLLYHAIIYYEIRKFVQESDPNALTYEMVIEKAKAHERNVLEYKDHQASHGGATVRLPTIIHCYLLMHCLKDGPVAAVIMANVVANVASLMSGAIVLRMGKLAIGAKASVISKLSVIPRLQPRRGQSPHRSKKSQPPRRGSTGSYNGQGKGGGNRQHQKKKTPKKPPKQNAYAVTMKKLGPIRSNNYIWWQERETG